MKEKPCTQVWQAGEPLDLARLLTSSLSHDLRSPFNASIGVLQLVLSEFDTMPKQELRELLESLLENNHSHLSYISNLLFYSRLELGTLDTTFSECTLIDLALALDAKESSDTSLTKKICLPLLNEAFTQIKGAWQAIDPKVKVRIEVLADSSTGNFQIRVLLDETDTNFARYFPAREINKKLPSPTALALVCATRIFDKLEISIQNIEKNWIFDF